MKKTADTLARDIMSSNVITVRPQQTYRDAIELLSIHRLTGLPVTDERGMLLGMLSEKDILVACGSFDRASSKFLDSRIKFKKPVHSATLMTSINKVASILSGKSYRHVPVVDERGILQGIITRRDLIRILYIRIELAGKGLSA